MISHLYELCVSPKWNSDLSKQEKTPKNNLQTLEIRLQELRQRNLEYLETITYQDQQSQEVNTQFEKNYDPIALNANLNTIELTNLSEVNLATPQSKKPLPLNGEEEDEWDLCEISSKNSKNPISKKEEWVKL